MASCGDSFNQEDDIFHVVSCQLVDREGKRRERTPQTSFHRSR